jgi:peptide-methionine (S)-S-oxide reductase
MEAGMEQQATTTEIATLGGGCFWCVEAVFIDLRGVLGVVSGYAGGQVANPSYKDVCTGTTGHAEVVQVTFDPAVIAYDDLLRMFFAAHDPTTLNRQGNDSGPQYRSVIFTGNAAQRAAAERVRAEIDTAQIWAAPIVTDIQPLDTFYPATADHQDYFARNPWSGYCQAIIAPKVRKFRKQFGDRLRAVPTA